MSGDAPTQRVAIALHEQSLGGTGISVTRVVPTLFERGWRFAFWCAKPSETYDQLRAWGLEVHGAPRHVAYSIEALRAEGGVLSSLSSMPRYFRSFRRFLRDYRPDVVHANSLYCLAELLVARAAGYPAVYYVHGAVARDFKVRIARRLAYGKRTEVVAVSESCAELLRRPGKPLRTVYGGVPLPGVPERSGERIPLVVGTVGAIGTRNGSDIFVEAARLVGDQRDDIDFRMIGGFGDVLEVEWAKRLVEKGRGFGIGHSPQADVFATLPDWDIFALPSRIDAFPIVVLEAMASGLPVAAARTGGIPEQVTPDTGILVEPEDPRALARAIIELADDPQKRARMGRAGRRRVEELFTLERQALGLEQAYLDAIKS